MHSNNIGKQIKKLRISKNSILITFIDKSTLSVPFDCYEKYLLKEKKILSDKQYKELYDAHIINKNKDYLLKLISKHSYSKKQIKEKLIKRKLNNDQIKTLIDYLEKYHLLNDDTYISDFIRCSNTKNHSLNRIKNELVIKGIPIEKVNSITSDYSIEYRKANNLISPKLRYQETYSYQLKKKKIYETLIRQGYEKDIIEDIIKEKLIYSYEEEMKNLRKEYSIAFSKYRFKYLGDLLYKKVIQYLLRKGYSLKDIEIVEREYKNEISE